MSFYGTEVKYDFNEKYGNQNFLYNNFGCVIREDEL